MSRIAQTSSFRLCKPAAKAALLLFVASATINRMKDRNIENLLWAVIGMLLVGCAKPPPVTPVTSKTPDPDPAATLEVATDLELVQRYSGLSGYSDDTLLTLTYHFDDGRTEVDQTNLSVQFARPNRLSLRVASEDNRVLVASDGTQMTARIIDPITKNFDNQVVVRDAPETLSITDIYKATEVVDPITPGEMVSVLMGAPTGLDMTPLSLLLGEGQLFELVRSDGPGEVALRDLGLQAMPNGLESARYQVVSATVGNETYRIWVRPDSGEIRRIEFPPTRSDLPPGIKKIELVAEFSDVRFSSDDEFKAHDEGQEVSHFVLPPLEPPTELFGEVVEGLVLENRSGELLDVSQGDEKISVLAWFHNHPASRLVIDRLEDVKNRFESRGVRFIPVFVESSENLSKLDAWQSASSVWFDPKAGGRDVLGVTEAPTAVVLGRDASVQYFEVGANPNIGNDVSVVLERLLSGQNVAKETLAVTQQAQAAYQQQLALAKAGDGWIEQTEATMPAASEPTKLQLTKKWSSNEVTEPGNMLIVPGKKKHILVADGWNKLVILDPDGALKRRINLSLPAEEGITILRAGKDERDRALIAAATRGGRHAFLFDFGGKLIMQYPRIANEEAIISDIAVGELTKGKPQLLVGWQGNLGVHGVSVSGKQLWTNRVMPGVESLSVAADRAARNKFAAVAGETGSIYLVDNAGRTSREAKFGPSAVHRIVSWPASARSFEGLIANELPQGDDAAIHCGFAFSPSGQAIAIGANIDWEPVWQHTLPPGVYRHQIDAAQTIEIDELGHAWLFAGPDGSVHCVSLDGKFRDTWTVGDHIRGLAALNVGGSKPVVVVNTDGGVTAFEVNVKP